MTVKSAAFERVCEAAVAHFAVAGYDGASLNEIALMVGIKKASLYSHVASKDALYLQVLHDAAEQEMAFAANALQKTAKPRGASALAGPGASFIYSIAKRYEDSVHLRFLLRAAFLPPVALKADVGKVYDGFLHAVEQGFKVQLRQAAPEATTAQMNLFATAYVGVVDSLYVELVYVDKARMTKRAKALWQVFVDSLQYQGLLA
ncbi:TetR/AcrR family transcriptional regulator [Lampropedia aestuarii]|uniref:TetR/AcrR family transcriptional regulator n=1 Tax=Lampropedia aestuarii TaxID=2562762 RepID=A0A4S5BUE1_9BURK|nr:TetR/AcrR family transcriptional regulator [Lampropedia aestuarii]MDH5859157.1 TetR/AcrR family transcriptional regulator [Lampropedia aestuarii]THJ36554.1 TetR/AcrR family transcriptional regulator [Lampropedia aestuarii]